jgi:hypothetical protein
MKYMAKNAQAPNYNPPVPDIVRNYNNLDEMGRIGQMKYAGVFSEEFENNLRGRRGVEMYKEMSENDDIIGAILFAIEMLIRQAKFEIEPQGKSKQDKIATDFVDSCIHDMQQTWQDTLSEILSFLTFGWAWHEICYKRRMGKQKDPRLNSKFDDGLIGWQKLPIRSQDTLWRWEYDENDTLVALSQMAPPDFAIRTIPIEKSIHFITKSKKWNPEGRSILRNAYRSYYFKKRMQEIEAIGVERDLAGLPLMTPPEGVNIWDTEDQDAQRCRLYAEKIVQNIRRDSMEGVVIPFGWKLELLGSSSKRQFDVEKIIERFDSRMAMTVLADFVLMGHQSVGSFALSSDKTELFSTAIGTYLDIICEAFNKQAIPRLIDLNGDHFKGITDYPKMVHGDIEDKDITKMSTYLKDMIGIGLIVPDENLQQYARRLADLPESIDGAPLPGTPEAQRLIPTQQASQQQTATSQQNNTQNKSSLKVDPQEEADDDDADEADLAKARLGRK